MYQIFTYQFDLVNHRKVGEGQSYEVFDTIEEAEKALPDFRITTPTFRQYANIGRANIINMPQKQRALA